MVGRRALSEALREAALDAYPRTWSELMAQAADQIDALQKKLERCRSANEDLTRQLDLIHDDYKEADERR